MSKVNVVILNFQTFITLTLNLRVLLLLGDPFCSISYSIPSSETLFYTLVVHTSKNVLNDYCYKFENVKCTYFNTFTPFQIIFFYVCNTKRDFCICEVFKMKFIINTFCYLISLQIIFGSFHKYFKLSYFEINKCSGIHFPK